MTHVLFAITTVNETYAEDIAWTHCNTLADAWLLLVGQSKKELTNGDRETFLIKGALNKYDQHQSWRVVDVQIDCTLMMLSLIVDPDKMGYYVWIPDSKIAPNFVKSRASAFAAVTKLVDVNADDASNISEKPLPVTLEKGNRHLLLASLADCVSF